MKRKFGIIIFALIEILIGSITLIAVILSVIQAKSAKPAEVLFFVLAAAAVSLILGCGILRLNISCYYLLLYFSSVIIFSKVLIFAKIITLSGELETIIPPPLKNVASILYHGLLMLYFTRKPVKNLFGEHRND